MLNKAQCVSIIELFVDQFCTALKCFLVKTAPKRPIVCQL